MTFSPGASKEISICGISVLKGLLVQRTLHFFFLFLTVAHTVQSPKCHIRTGIETETGTFHDMQPHVLYVITWKMANCSSACVSFYCLHIGDRATDPFYYSPGLWLTS